MKRVECNFEKRMMAKCAKSDVVKKNYCLQLLVQVSS